MAEGAGLLNRCSVLGRYRGFESLSLRLNKKNLFFAYASSRFFFVFTISEVKYTYREISLNIYHEKIIL